MPHTYKVPTAPVIQDIEEDEAFTEDGYQDLDGRQQTEEENLDRTEQEERLQTEETQEEEEGTLEETQNEETEEESEEESGEGTDENPFKDFSEAAVYAAELKRTGYFGDDYEINKEASHHDVFKDMVEAAKAKAIENAKAELLQKGYTEEHFKRQDYLASGGDPSVLSQVGLLRNLASADPKTEEEQDQYLQAMYNYKGLNDPEDVKELIQRARDLGKMDDRLKEAKELFGQLYNQAEEQLRPQEPDPEEIKRIEAERKQNIKRVIDKGEIGPFNPMDEKRKELFDFVTERKYLTVRQDEYGNKVNQFVTGFDRAFADLAQDMEKQMVLAYLLMNDFNLSEVTSKVKNETVNSALNYLNRVPKKQTRKKVTNPYYRE